MSGFYLKASICLVLAILCLCSGCIEKQEQKLKVATTTSLYDTKLLDVLEQRFEEIYGIKMDVVSGGTGIAIQHGERGDVDLLLVHDKAREIDFIEKGYGLYRRCFAYNYFYLIGPKDDPVGLAGINAPSAFSAIMKAGMNNPNNVKFISRADNSGTHSKEKAIWKKSGINSTTINTTGNWYVEAGQGMGATLMMANEMSAYTLSDMSTYMAYSGNLTIVPLIKEDADFLNVYSAIPINPAKNKGVNCEVANKFVDFLVSDEGQKLISEYGESQYGQPLFFPARGNCDLIGCNETECASPSAPCPAAA